jgi:simple sugar transport system ATP-binding protein
MVGRSLTDELYGRAAGSSRVRSPGEKVLSVQNLSMQNFVRNTSFSIFAGQVTGVFGLVGSGRTETARIIAGIVKRDLFHGGDVRLNGKSVRYRTPRDAVSEGVVYVTEDRKSDGFFETMSVAENIYIGQISSPESRGIAASVSETNALAANWRNRLNIKTLNSDASVVELSGGNQQKVVIAKALVQKPKLIIFRRADARRRCRRHRRDPPHYRQARRRRSRGGRHILVFAGNPEPVGQDTRLETGSYR